MKKEGSGQDGVPSLTTSRCLKNRRCHVRRANRRPHHAQSTMTKWTWYDAIWRHWKHYTSCVHIREQALGPTPQDYSLSRMTMTLNKNGINRSIPCMQSNLWEGWKYQEWTSDQKQTCILFGKWDEMMQYLLILSPICSHSTECQTRKGQQLGKDTDWRMCALLIVLLVIIL